MAMVTSRVRPTLPNKRWGGAMIKDYKGYSAKVAIDEEQGILHGEVLGIVDVVTFEGSSVEELVKAFHDSVDDYLAYCEERGEEPDKPYSGRFVLRMSPQLHRMVAVAAKKNELSMNDWITSAVERFLEEETPSSGMTRCAASESRSQHLLHWFAGDELREFSRHSATVPSLWVTHLLSEAIWENWCRRTVPKERILSILKELLPEEPPKSSRRKMRQSASRQ